MKTATLMLVWKFEEVGKPVRWLLEDFADEGTMGSLCAAVAAHLEIADGGAAFWHGVAGDYQRAVLENRQQIVALGEVIERQKGIIEYAKNKLGPLMEAAV